MRKGLPGRKKREKKVSLIFSATTRRGMFSIELKDVKDREEILTEAMSVNHSSLWERRRDYYLEGNRRS